MRPSDDDVSGANRRPRERSASCERTTPDIVFAMLQKYQDVAKRERCATRSR